MVLLLPEFITLIEYYGSTTAKKRLKVYISIPLGEILEFLILVNEPIHIRVLWRVYKLPRSYFHLSQWHGEVVAFAWDVIEGMLPTTVHINTKWW